MKKILIYKDFSSYRKRFSQASGVHPFCLKALIWALKQAGVEDAYQLRWADRTLLETPGWSQDTALLIFPGGRDNPYQEALQGIANQQIVEFVKKGGSFLGLCAGGYYASGSIEFQKGGPLEIIAQRELKFFPGVAQGPAYEPSTFCYKSEKGARTAYLRVETSGATLPVYYNGGCFFVDADKHPNVTVLARYEDIPSHPAAVIECSVERGKAILSGVHVEYSAYCHETRKRLKTAHLIRLKRNEELLRALFSTLLKRLIAPF